MNSTDAKPLRNTSRRLTYWLSALLTPALIFYLENAGIVRDFIRTIERTEFDYHKYGNIILFSLMLLFNLVIVLITQWRLPVRKQLGIWIWTILASVVSGIIMFLLFYLVMVFGFTHGHWAFG
jgi:fatty acid desaturase